MTELEEMFNMFPISKYHAVDDWKTVKEGNTMKANLFIDSYGSISIYPEGGGWLGITKEGKVEADIAPWCD